MATEYREFDSKGRCIVYRDGDAFQYDREFDDDWDPDVPAHVVEYRFGELRYERHYNTVVVDKGLAG